jgi:hypothetical protein
MLVDDGGYTTRKLFQRTKNTIVDWQELLRNFNPFKVSKHSANSQLVMKLHEYTKARGW